MNATSLFKQREINLAHSLLSDKSNKMQINVKWREIESQRAG